MEPAATVSSGIVNHPRSMTVGRPAAAPLFTRLCHAIESTDWDETLLHTPWIDRACSAVIVLSLLFLVPILARILL